MNKNNENRFYLNIFEHNSSLRLSKSIFLLISKNKEYKIIYFSKFYNS